MLVQEIYGRIWQANGPASRLAYNAQYAWLLCLYSGLYQHTISEDTPGAIVEMGFLSNAADREFMLMNRDLVAVQLR
jgi:hypothetical protein